MYIGGTPSHRMRSLTVIPTAHGGMLGLGVGHHEPDAGVDSDLVDGGTIEGDRGAGARRRDLDPRVVALIGASSRFSKPRVST